MAVAPAKQFFVHLATRLRQGCRLLPPAFVGRLQRAVRLQQTPWGAFGGPDATAGPDIYYTAFGFRTLDMLGCLTADGDFPPRLIEWLNDRVRRADLSLTDLVSLLEIRRIQGGRGMEATRELVPELRRAGRRVLKLHRVGDDGYGRVPGGPLSTYGTFLGTVAARALNLPVPPSARVRAGLLRRRRHDGGFAESSGTAISGASPTAAAVAVFHESGGAPAEVASRAAVFLSRLQTSRGGFKPHAAAHHADLLSTFTALTALDLLGALSKIRRSGALRFTRGLRRGDGLFAATAVDCRTDVEYAYYGGAVAALLAASLNDETRQRREGPEL
ncbi:MAG: terpene cyclase/mutase family protein [Kiritimatiellaeota bacterium]|nr:terpene cyclase/mutase family protein [Kiritimatiellota bacterium]